MELNFERKKSIPVLIFILNFFWGWLTLFQMCADFKSVYFKINLHVKWALFACSITEIFYLSWFWNYRATVVV